MYIVDTVGTFVIVYGNYTMYIYERIVIREPWSSSRSVRLTRDNDARAPALVVLITQ